MACNQPANGIYRKQTGMYQKIHPVELNTYLYLSINIPEDLRIPGILAGYCRIVSTVIQLFR
ncbi:hypothetical protein SAMN05661012_00728 [Chitinophaga sancti]|uniref:Uncharacterized protein n=1 Tax=Chitinophaga sancti TaxID=1004 RepID=A0A1K1MNA3_9BACT|nr:hypothetical protein SAMN05661012_00728 [Chitinophaga sancti]